MSINLNYDPPPGFRIASIERDVMLATCNRCMYEWEPKIDAPKQCPKCKSPYWNKPRKLLIDERGRVNKYGFDEIKVGEWKEFKSAPPLPDGSINMEANARFWRALEQYMRRKGYTYSWEGTATKFRVMRRT